MTYCFRSSPHRKGSTPRDGWRSAVNPSAAPPSPLPVRVRGVHVFRSDVGSVGLCTMSLVFGLYRADSPAAVINPEFCSRPRIASGGVCRSGLPRRLPRPSAYARRLSVCDFIFKLEGRTCMLTSTQSIVSILIYSSAGAGAKIPRLSIRGSLSPLPS